MKSCFKSLILCCFLVGSAIAQTEDTYISYQNDRNIIFEGQIAPSYPVLKWGQKEDRRDNFSGELIVVPKVLLKMYQSQSRPVKSPSYMPKITLQTHWKANGVTLSPFITIGHHSNGQAGPTVISDQKTANSGDSIENHQLSIINLESGSFATNYIQLGYRFSLSSLPNHSFGISYEHHPIHGWWFRIDKDIEDIYGRKRLHYEYQYASKGLQIDLAYTKIYDESELADRVSSHIYSATARIRLPVFKNLVWGFVSYYQGQDYYNIHFTEQIRQLKMGIAIQTKLVSL